MNTMIKNLLLSLVILVSVNTLGQNNILTNKVAQRYTVESDDIMNHQRNWVKLFESEKLSIHFRFENCYSASRGTNHEKVYIQIKNFTTSDLSIQYWLQKWSDENCINCIKEGSNYLTRLTLPAKTTLEGSCDEDSDRQLELFSKMLDHNNQVNITKLKLVDLSIQ